jgi:uncharacterized protein YlaN (UPF0358 family)
VLNWTSSIGEEEAAATATLAESDESLSHITASTSTLPVCSTYEGVLDFSATSFASKDFSSLLQSTESLFASLHAPPPDIYQRISPYKTVLLNTAVAVTFATEYHNLPVRAMVEVRTMPWGVLYYTLTSAFKNRVTKGRMLQLRGMLSGLWKTEENLCNHEDYAFVRLTNQAHRLETIVAVFQDSVDLPDPIGGDEEFRRVLSVEWSSGCTELVSQTADHISWQHETSATSEGQMGVSAPLRWEAIENSSTYSVVSNTMQL